MFVDGYAFDTVRIGIRKELETTDSLGNQALIHSFYDRYLGVYEKIAICVDTLYINPQVFRC